MTVEDDNIIEDSVSEPQPSEPRVFPGDLLRAAREAKGYSTQEVATYLCLRRQLIEEIDDNKFDPKVAATFTRGYLKAYAKYVGISETEVLEAYSDLTQEKPRLGNMQSFSRKKTIEAQDSRLMLITYIIIAVLIASFVLFIWQQSGSDEEAESVINTNGTMSNVTRNTTNKATAEPDPVNESPEIIANELVASEEEREANLERAAERVANNTIINKAAVEAEKKPVVINATAQTATAVTQIAEEQSTAVQADVPTSEIEEPAPAPVVNRTGTFLDEADPTAGELVLYFLSSSWVEVLNANDFDNRLAFGIKRRGYNMPLGGAEAYTIAIEVPYAVEVYYRGERVDLTALNEGQVNLIRIPNL